MKNIAWAGVVLGLSFVFLPAQVCAGETIEQLRVSGARVVTDPKTSIARFIGFDAHGVVDRVALAGAAANAARQQMPAEATAAQHLSTYAALFGLRDASSETRPMRQRISRDGRSMNRYQQLHLGVPIIAGELIVNQTAERQLTSISGKISPELKIDVTPVISAVRAGEIARQAMAKWYQLPEADFVVPDPILSIYDSRLISPHEDPIVLVWRIEVSTRSLRPINEFIAVDAITGVIPVHFNQVPHAKNRITYDANNMTSLPGVIACDESNPTCAGKIQDAISAHRYVGKTYDFYMSNFGRDGIDGAGLTMISSVRVCGTTACPLTPYANAAWTGTQMIYGANLSQAEDVVAHELTHGVTQFESGLFYYYQSGAINESLSDIFGEFVQQGDPDGTVTAATKWQIAEDLAPFGFSWGGYLRSMANPLLKDQPDKMTSSKYFTGITNLLTPSSQRPGDNGGVHIINMSTKYVLSRY